MNDLPFIIDCDTGRDDALTIFAATARGLKLAGLVSSYGNVNIDQVTENCARVCQFAQRADMPIIRGASEPLQRYPSFESVIVPRQNKSGNGLCNIELPPAKNSQIGTDGVAEEFLRLHEKHGRMDYVILGPASNFAMLCQHFSPDIHDYIGDVYMMGGKLSPLWEEMPGADFNILCDPLAVKTIMDAGIVIHFVPMNFTWPIALTVPQLEALRGSSEMAVMSRAIMLAHAQYFSPDPIFRFHDPCLIFVRGDKDHFREAHIDINLTEGAEFARLAEKADGYKAQIFTGDNELRRAYAQKILSALGFEDDEYDFAA
ncbi:MAG: nucleoside hydrolase [Alphaproteobacteria bacterium]|nr:nucleoside hydrolase [Alphaproteobacteria bacterium]